MFVFVVSSHSYFFGEYVSLADLHAGAKFPSIKSLFSKNMYIKALADARKNCRCKTDSGNCSVDDCSKCVILLMEANQEMLLCVIERTMTTVMKFINTNTERRISHSKL